MRKGIDPLVRRLTKRRLQLDTRQVCVLDPKHRQVALLVKGRGPAVMLPPRCVEAVTEAGR
ncbi:MAG: hypothetical protein ACOY3P_26680 [Planctomycetota bacterium]